MKRRMQSRLRHIAASECALFLMPDEAEHLLDSDARQAAELRRLRAENKTLRDDLLRAKINAGPYAGRAPISDADFATIKTEADKTMRAIKAALKPARRKP